LRKLFSWILILSAIVTAFILGYRSAAWIPMAERWFYTFLYGENWQIFRSYIDLGMSIARVIGKAVLILIGLHLWRQSKHIGKWVGAGLILIISLSFVPNILAIPIIIITVFIGYAIHKINRKKRKQNIQSEFALQEDRQDYAAILEKWDNTVR